MNVHFTYRAPKTPDTEKEVNQGIEKLRRRLQLFRPELVSLHGDITENTPREGTTVTLNLRLPSGQMAATAASQSPGAALRQAYDDLIEQLAKHKARLRAEHKWPRTRRVGRPRPQPQVPFEETLAAVHPPTISPDDISSWVNANLPRLNRFVDRELRWRENSGQLRPGQLSREEVVDEAISMALSDGEKPEKIALEPWLYRLALRAIDDLISRQQEVGNVHLEQPAAEQDVNSEEAAMQYHQPDESMVARELIADPRISSPEDTAYSEEMITLVEAALLGAKPADREAFLLFGIEGFTPEEISTISGRPVEDVRNSIRAAREHLRKALPVPNEFKDKLLEHTRIA